MQCAVSLCDAANKGQATGDVTMSLECSECERDLRGGHDSNCTRHPVNVIMALIDEYDSCHDDEFRLKKELRGNIQAKLELLYRWSQEID